MVKKLAIVILLSVFCAACGLGGSGGGSQRQVENDDAVKRDEGSEGGAITIYTSRHYEADSALFESFTKLTGIKVIEVKGTAEELVARIKRDGAESDADLFFTVDGGVLNNAKHENILQPLRSDRIARQVPAKWRDSNDYWIGVTTRARVIVYAKNRVRLEELSTYESLTEGKWKGRVLIRSHSSLYNQSLLASFIAVNGKQRTEAWAQGIVNNFARMPEGGDLDQAKAIADGVGDVAIINTYYLGQLAGSSDSEDARMAAELGVFFPNQETTGTHVNISGIGMVRYSKNKDKAQQLVEYMTSKEGQTLLVQRSYEYPVNDEAELPEPIQSWGPFKSQQLDFAKLERYRQEAIDIFKRVGWT